MDQSEPVSTTLVSLAGGAAVELFDTELQKVLDNILDPNTDAEAVRTIALIVKVKPSPQRDIGALVVSATCKLAPYQGASSTLYLGRRGSRVVAVEYDPRQSKMFSEEQAPVTGVIEGGKR